MATKTEIVEAGKHQAAIVINNAFIDGMASQIEEKKKYGLSFPADYNPVNALNGAYLILKETTDKNGKPVLETCSQTSIANTLMDMVTMGLSMQKNQCYPVVYAGKLQCQVSYHGNKTMAHRYGAKKINAEVIYEGDDFEYHIENGVKVLDKHIQNFQNIDLDKIIGAYCVIEMKDGSTYMEIMNMNQIKTAWKKGYGYKDNGGVHKDFADMMAKKTVTNRACKLLVQQYGDGYETEILSREDNISYTDRVEEDVAYDIEQNANKEEFVMENDETESVESEVIDTTSSDVPFEV